MAIGSDNKFPKVFLTTQASNPSTPTGGDWKVFAKANGIFAMGSNATAVGPFGTGGGISSGTSFPGAPSADDLYYRTDHDTLYFYNGTRWLSVDLRERMLIPKALPPYSTNDTRLYCPAWDSTYDVWIEDWVLFTVVDATNNGSHYWTFSFDKATNVGGSTSLATSNTSADTAGQFIDKRIAVNALFGTTSTNTWLIVGNTETGTAGNVSWLASYFTYRRVGS